MFCCYKIYAWLNGKEDEMPNSCQTDMHVFLSFQSTKNLLQKVVYMTLMNCSCQHDIYSNLTRSILIICFIQVHELKHTPTHTHMHKVKISYSSTLCSCHVHTGIGRVSLHGNMVTQCSWFFWLDSLIGVFTTGRGEGAIAIKLTNFCIRIEWSGGMCGVRYINCTRAMLYI